LPVLKIVERDVFQRLLHCVIEVQFTEILPVVPHIHIIGDDRPAVWCYVILYGVVLCGIVLSYVRGVVLH
jgi:hypothetical protein